ncbi:MAG: hypothetical protein KAR19_10295 [Bacteroidales bacterium]|nr:hypothetical protein [Bacteroidales bacterium]
MQRKALLLVICITLVVVSAAQEYVPFPTEQVHWNVLVVATCDDSHPPDTTLARYAIHGDTTIQEVDYMRLCLEKGDTVNPVIEPVGGLREEEKKIYFIGRDFGGAPHNDEVLLYDFNARVGDTVRHLQDDHPTFFSVIEEIDSMQIGVDYRRRYLVDHN